MMENIEIIKTIGTLLFSIMSCYFLLREKISRANQKNEEQTKDIQLVREEVKKVAQEFSKDIQLLRDEIKNLRHGQEIIVEKRQTTLNHIAIAGAEQKNMKGQLSKLEGVDSQVEEIKAESEKFDRRLHRIEDHIFTKLGEILKTLPV